MTVRPVPSNRDDGTVAIELVAVLPLLVLVTLALVQSWLMVSAVESTTRAARDAARAAAREDDGESAAYAGLPAWIEVEDVSVSRGAVPGCLGMCSRISVRIPFGVPGFVEAGSIAVVRTADFPISQD